MGRLTEEQREVLQLLTEECSEVIKAISKADRFGLDSVYEGKTNLESFQQEIADVLALIAVITVKHPNILGADYQDVMGDYIRSKLHRLKKHCTQLSDLDVEELMGDWNDD